jgi:hypothetical protein
MRVNLNFSRTFSGAAITALTLALLTVAQAKQRNGSESSISNFGRINENLYHGKREQVI